jgi:putative endonuclease
MSQTPQKQLGDRGEALVAEWLQQQGWAIAAQQWRCRWGELDIVAQHPQAGIAFVEVKTRQQGSLDLGGRLAMTRPKQQKLWRSAQTFLSQHPEWDNLPCRFDVALVAQGKRTEGLASVSVAGQLPLTLVDYIENAFQVE